MSKPANSPSKKNPKTPEELLSGLDMPLKRVVGIITDYDSGLIVTTTRGAPAYVIPWDRLRRVMRRIDKKDRKARIKEAQRRLRQEKRQAQYLLSEMEESVMEHRFSTPAQDPVSDTSPSREVDSIEFLQEQLYDIERSDMIRTEHGRLARNEIRSKIQKLKSELK